jgi:hypothetical protein
MIAADMAATFQGPVRILDENGFLLAVALADLGYDEGSHNWVGELELVPGTGVAGKALVVDLEIDGTRGRAQLKPISNDGAQARSSLVGLGPQPF